MAASITFRLPAERSLAVPNANETAAAAHSQHLHGSSTWLKATDYCNGGPLFVAAGSARSSSHSSAGSSAAVEALPGVQVLARYTAVQHPSVPALHGGEAVAAVRCEVGAGVAVLCGTHPELGPEWWIRAAAAQLAAIPAAMARAAPAAATRMAAADVPAAALTW